MKGCVIMLSSWALKEKDLGGRIFSSRNRLVPPSQWGVSPIWDKCVLAIYEGERIPYGRTIVFDKNHIPIGSSVIERGQLVRVWPIRIVKGNNSGNVVVTLKMKHAYRRGIPEDTVPEFYGRYLNDVLLHYEPTLGIYRAIKCAINGEIYTNEDSGENNSVHYHMQLMETLCNELIYLDTQPIDLPGREEFQIYKDRFYMSKYRYINFNFFLSHMEWVFEYEREEKELEEKKRAPIVAIRSTTYNMTGDHIGTINKYSITNPSQTYLELFDQMTVEGKPISENIVSKSAAQLKYPPMATALDSGTGWVVVYWPRQHYHAFWVFKLSDYAWFVDSHGVLDRTKKDDTHKFYSFRHTEPSYIKLMRMVYNKEVTLKKK